MCSLKLLVCSAFLHAVQIAAVMKNDYFLIPFFKGNYFWHNFQFKLCWVDCVIVICLMMFHKWSRTFEESESVEFLGMLQNSFFNVAFFCFFFFEYGYFPCIFQQYMNYSTLYQNNVLLNILSKVLWQTAVWSILYCGCLFCYCSLTLYLHFMKQKYQNHLEFLTGKKMEIALLWTQ